MPSMSPDHGLEVNAECFHVILSTSFSDIRQTQRPPNYVSLPSPSCPPATLW